MPLRSRGLKTLIASGTPLLLSLINYAEMLVRPAGDERDLRAAIDALTTLGIRLVARTPAIAVDAARHRALHISLADGFALSTAQAHRASVASFDRRVRRALPQIGLKLASEFA
jgi:PIN domain nuclease of toxin-antitoxin system